MRKGVGCGVVSALLLAGVVVVNGGTAGAAQSGQSGQTLHVVTASMPNFGGDPFQAVAAPRWEITGAVFDPLTEVGPKGAIPWLATSWTQVDPTTWNFTLRKGIKFSNGEAFNAESVVTAVNALATPVEASSVANLYLSGLAGASVVSNYVVQIKTKAPDGILPQQVSALVPVPTDYWNQVGQAGFEKAPIGTGPYKVVSLSSDQWVLKANPTSWHKPKIGTIIFTALSDFTARDNAVTSGQAQINLEGTVDQIASLKSSGLTTHIIPDTGVFVLQYINKGAPSPIDNQQVREALNYAINRKQILKALYNNVTTAATQGVNPGTVGYDPSLKPTPYNPAKAKQLLAQAGYPNGFTFTAVVTIGSFPEDQQMFETVQSQLKAIGVTMNIDTVNVTQAVTYLLSGNYPGQVFSTAYQSAPENDATKAYSTYSCLRPTSVYCDPVAANDLQAAMTIPPSSARTKALNALAQQETSNPAAIWLVNNFYVTVTAKSVHGYNETGADVVDWNKITLGSS